MSGATFWATIALLLTSSSVTYLVGYRAGWTDGVADARRWQMKSEQA